MQKIYIISHIRPHDVGRPLVDELSALHPEGLNRPGTTSASFSCKLPEDDPRLMAILKRLEEGGLRPWSDFSRMPDSAREFNLRVSRKYEPHELEAVAYVKLITPRGVKSGDRDEEGRIKLGVDTIESGVDIAMASLAGARFVVPDRIKQLFESSDLIGPTFRATVPHRKGGYGGPATWKQAGGPWWELTSDVTMPPMSSRMTLTDGNGRPLRDGDFTRGVVPQEGLYTNAELRYTTNSMASMPPFDLARTFEPIGPNPTREDRFLIASKRLCHFCQSHGLKVNWSPVHIDPD